MGHLSGNLNSFTARLIVAVSLGVGGVCAGGCGLFRRPPSLEDISKPEDKGRATLPSIRRRAETVGLELVFVDRPASDPLLRESELWRGVDTVGELTQEVRNRLHKNGFRVGHSSSTPNDALETMLGLTTVHGESQSRENLTGTRIFRPKGGDTEIQTSRPHPEFLAQQSSPGERPLRFRNARCVFRVKILSAGKGWAKLEFTPEIHHGRHGWRPIATGDGWEGKTGQNAYRLFDHRFQITLNAGEMAILTADPESTRLKPAPASSWTALLANTAC